jgi:multidrug resistance efflux pump
MKRDVELGETLAANAVMFEISSTARKRIAADVDERDIAGVKLGAALAAHADGFPDEAFEAKGTNIRRQTWRSAETCPSRDPCIPAHRWVAGRQERTAGCLGRRRN